MAPPTSMSALLNQIDATEPEEKIKALIGAGADVNDADPTGWTPLMLATYMWDAHTYQRVGGQDEDRQSLHWQHGEWEKFSAKHDPVVIVKALVAAGALRRDGRSDAMEVAGQRGDKRAELLTVLRSAKIKSQD